MKATTATTAATPDVTVATDRFSRSFPVSAGTVAAAAALSLSLLAITALPGVALAAAPTPQAAPAGGAAGGGGTTGGTTTGGTTTGAAGAGTAGAPKAPTTAPPATPAPLVTSPAAGGTTTPGTTTAPGTGTNAAGGTTGTAGTGTTAPGGAAGAAPANGAAAAPGTPSGAPASPGAGSGPAGVGTPPANGVGTVNLPSTLQQGPDPAAVQAAVHTPPDQAVPASLPTSTALPIAPLLAPSQIPVTPQPNAATPPTPIPTKGPDETVTGAKPSDATPTNEFPKGTTPGQPLPGDPTAIRTLDDALNVAFHRSPSVLEAQERAYQTKREVDQLLAVKKPQISATGTYSRLFNPSSSAGSYGGASPASISNPFSTTLSVTPPGSSATTLSTTGGSTGGAGSAGSTTTTSTNSASTTSSSTSVASSTGSGSSSATRAEPLGGSSAALTRQTTGSGGSGSGSTTPGGGSTSTTTSSDIGRALNSTNQNQLSARVSLSQLIDITGIVKVAEQVGDLEEALSRIELARLRQQTALNVKNAYYNLLRAQAFVSVDEAAVADSEELLRVTQAQLAAGVASNYDVLSARTQLDNNRQALISARNQVAIYKNALANTIGIDPSTPVNPQPLPVPPLPALDEEALIQQAFKQRPEYLEADISQIVAKKNIRLAHRNLDPYVSAGISGAYDPTASSFTQDKATGNIGATLTVPLYDGGATRAAEDQARSQARTADIQKDQFARGIKSEVQQAIISVNDANERSLAIASTVVAAQEALRLAGVRFRSGVGTQLDVNNAQSQLIQAQNNQVSALFDYLSALARLSLAVGTPQ